ncbi:GntR family transcriptional regulator [Frigidibacter sp. SD6-1]|uniref:GntR family transcriptional regulator n=1 Tax=Frigidibacter sp. SD6-1 TaxID=3032581 RepID=UPI0032E80202
MMALKLKATNLGSMPSPADVIFEALREAIVEGELKDGETLRQDHIASLFNVSRIPVREALARLEEQGLVTTQRHKGAVVSSLSLEEIAEMFEFRALVEGEVIRHAVSGISDRTLAEAKAFAEAFAAEPDSARWAQLNRLFHYTLYKDCGRPYHLQVVSKALDKIARYLRAQLVLTHGIARARQEHEGILRAAMARDADEAAALTRAHILGASRSLISFLQTQEKL